ncbi:sigma-70 family RNA polymerase sigma factor [Virgibacillus doumboii]|uniref:sigma-70 family RNA polymerase sigma factor n=1 Tax=Virgibacillus doumboii TaxID=2697503 RepID=UPI0013DF90CC|nr:sigma-70 family RNA polymerase sigma factor [Virgibacillus doumboii]
MDAVKEVKKAKKGNKASFEKLIYEYQDVMYRVAKSIVKRDEDCADAIQEAIYNAYRSIPNLREPQYFKTWLLRIVTNECYSIIRSRKKVVELKEWNEGFEEDKGFDAVEMELLLARLPQEDSEILGLFYINDLTIKDISGILDIPANTVKTRIRRAKQKLHHFLTETNKEVSGQWKNGKTR